MKEGVLDILIYLFENYFDAETDDGFEPDRETLKLELEKAGFPGSEVERALCWLEELAADPDRLHPTPTSRAIRVFAALEQARLDTDCRGYLVHLEQVGILSPTQRELVIDRLLVPVVRVQRRDLDPAREALPALSEPGRVRLT